jgi:dihydrolipoamide dehydrogenase
VESFDAIVIGSGQGGVPLAAELAARGQRVVLFERGRLGGSCVNYGCTPSKTFLASAHAAGQARRAATLGVEAEVSVDSRRVMERVRGVRDQWTGGTERRLEKAGVRVVRGEAAFTGERVVAGGGVEATAPLVVINTGTSPALGVPGLEGTPYLTNETFFELEELPESVIVLGGGYIGLELGQGLARLGARVQLVDRNDRVLGNEEPEVSEVLQEALNDDGVSLHLGQGIESVRHGDGFEAVLSGGGRVRGQALLAALGRRPNTAALRLERSGIATDERGFIATDDQLRTSCEGVFAIGDVAGQSAFTHVSWEDHRRVLSVLEGGSRTRYDRALGYALFTDPQVGRVGLTLARARDQGLPARAVTLPAGHVARAVEIGRPEGFYRLVVDTSSGQILGATLVGYEAAELVHVLLAHMAAGSDWRVLESSVHIHPTLAEGLPSLARKLLGPATGDDG